MKSNIKTSAVLAGLLCALVASSSQAFPARAARIRHEGTVLLKLRDSATNENREALNALVNRFGARIEKMLLKGRALRLKGLDPRLEEEILKQLKAADAVEYVEPDYYVAPTEILNDGFYLSQWHHAKIGSETAWKYSVGSKSVKVAVCDAGFDLNHPDLAPNWSLPGYNTVNNTNVVSNINDHGTHTAGVIGAVGNNGWGVAGVAYQISLLPIQVSGQADGMALYSDIAECIQYAADQGAKVVNISYGNLYASSIISEAARALRARGGLVVVSAGNDASDISVNGESPNLLVVGATDSNDQLASFSNYGKPVDLVAPGQGILTTSANSRFDYVDGTSFAAPIVTGAAALLYSLNPNLQPELVESILISTADDLGPVGPDLKFSNGRVQVGAAVLKALASNDQVAPSVVISSHRNGDPASGTIGVSAMASDNVGVASVEFAIDGQVFATLTATPYTADLNTTGLQNGLHTLTATAKDLNGNIQTSSVQIKVQNKSSSKSGREKTLDDIKGLFSNPWGRLKGN